MGSQDRGVYYKGYAHTRHGSLIGPWNIPMLPAGVTSHIFERITTILVNNEIKRNDAQASIQLYGSSFI